MPLFKCLVGRWCSALAYGAVGLGFPHLPLWQSLPEQPVLLPCPAPRVLWSRWSCRLCMREMHSIPTFRVSKATPYDLGRPSRDSCTLQAEECFQKTHAHSPGVCSANLLKAFNHSHRATESTAPQVKHASGWDGPQALASNPLIAKCLFTPPAGSDCQIDKKAYRWAMCRRVGLPLGLEGKTC